MNALRVAAATAGFGPRPLLDDNPLGIGVAAALGAGLALAGMLASLVAWRRRGRRSLRLAAPLVVLVVAHATTLAVFPTWWLIDWLQTPSVVFRVPTERPAFALTIDDGLDPDSTPRLLGVLRRHEARATFFVLGESLRDHPALARAVLADGHELANHQMNDKPAVALEPADLKRQVRECHALLAPLSGAAPRWFRPGGGVVTTACRQVADELGYRIALGSVFPFDSHLHQTRFLAAYVAQRTSAGAIVVLHEGLGRGGRAAAVLDKALGELTARGLRAVTLSELFAEAG
ncbi:polysaccharide deacetylase family protein [Botrimarina sp.]|uniref:polysaccharide deacetylase family protein n=1 Tax=Botrimarina sp. TaxID=2795802 RepID=UPI0032EFA0BC